MLTLFLDTNALIVRSIVHRYSFGQDNDVLSDLKEANRLRSNLKRLLRGVKFNVYFSWVLGITKLLPKSIGKSLMPPGVKDLIRFRQACKGFDRCRPSTYTRVEYPPKSRGSLRRRGEQE
jgi:hypothetical protein